MDAGNQQKIIGYFIEEAKEHLDTIEQGLLELRSVVTDPERVNEMFRAAHSVKGGAAMLGFVSLQKTAHKLEDSFKVLKENDISVDQKLETLFLRGYDTLKDLLDKLQSPFGLQAEEAEKTVQAAEPCFVELESYLNQLMSGSDESSTTTAPNPSLTPQQAQQQLPHHFAPQVKNYLKQMLQLFKQQETSHTRQGLQKHCKELFGLDAGNKTWQELVKISNKAIANPQNSYQTLAPVVIKELKQASDQLQQNQSCVLTPSPTLQQLINTTSPDAIKATDNEPKQITLTVEPKAAAKTIVQAFEHKQLRQLIKLLAQAARTQ
ncbi:MAG: histidine kinase [Symploca sp. SIO3E6]|nr:histidine kinase [Caldora sp. SIO3E6]